MTIRRVLPVALAAVLTMAFTSFGAESAPKIVIKDPQHDFGQVIDGATVTHDFTIKNGGDAPLVITRVRTD